MVRVPFFWSLATGVVSIDGVAAAVVVVVVSRRLDTVLYALKRQQQNTHDSFFFGIFFGFASFEKWERKTRTNRAECGRVGTMWNILCVILILLWIRSVGKYLVYYAAARNMHNANEKIAQDISSSAQLLIKTSAASSFRMWQKYKTMPTEFR